MTKTRMTLMLAAGIVALARVSFASHSHQDLTRAVARCVRTAQRVNPSFDAYVESTGTVDILGSPHGQFAFDRCMDQAGVPLVPGPNVE